MNRGSLLVLSLVLFGVLLAPSAVAQTRPTNMQSVILESFDDPDESPWMVRASKFIADDFPQVSFVRSWPDALYRREPEGVELRSLGVQAAFTRRGYNYLEIMPAEYDDDGNLVPRVIPGSEDSDSPRTGIPIPGLVTMIDLWVWGSNHEYYLEIQLRDYRGMIHNLRVGDIAHRGWRNHRVHVPTWIPQTIRYVPEKQGLELVKITLWTKPEEKVDDFFVYFDELRVMSDLYDEPFDGDELADPERIQELWATGQGGM
jgi:hypothetical protein